MKKRFQVITISFAAILGLIFFGLLGTGSEGRAMAGQKNIGGVRLITPQAGDLLTIGQIVTVSWETDGSTDNAVCEQEIYLSTDGGQTFDYRITPELSSRTRSFSWTVPDLKTKSAVLDIRRGTCDDIHRYESYNPQPNSMFAISGGKKRLSVGIASLTKTVAEPGDEVGVSWESNISDVDFFEVFVSYDRGAHFHSLGKSKESSMNWTVPDDFSGSATFRIVAHRASGAKVESPMSRTPLRVSQPEVF